MGRLPEGIRHVTSFVDLRVFEGAGGELTNKKIVGRKDEILESGVNLCTRSAWRS